MFFVIRLKNSPNNLKYLISVFFVFKWKNNQKAKYKGFEIFKE